MKKDLVEELKNRFDTIAKKYHEDETGDEKLEQLHASYQTVLEDLKRDRTKKLYS